MEALTNKNFEQMMKKELVIVDFWASWCGPCRAFGPIFEEVAERYSSRAEFLKCNCDEQRSLAQKLGIMSIPCIVAFKNGELVARHSGLMQEEVFSNFIEKLL